MKQSLQIFTCSESIERVLRFQCEYFLKSTIYYVFRNSGEEPSITINIAGDNSRRFVEQLLNLRKIIKSVSENPGKDNDVDGDGNGEPDNSASGNGSASGSGSGVGSGEFLTTADPITNRLIDPSDRLDSSTKQPHVVTPSTWGDDGSGTTSYHEYTTTPRSIEYFPITDDEDLNPQSGSGENATDPTSTKQSHVVTPSTGGDEGSGTTSYNEYTTTPTTVEHFSITDDEDLSSQSGSGENVTNPTSTTQRNTFYPSDRIKDEQIIHVKNIIGTPPVDNGSGVNVMPHVFLLFLFFVGLINI